MSPIETQEQLKAEYGRIRRFFTILAGATALLFLGNIAICRFALGLSSIQISAVSGILFQVLGAVWAVAFLGSYAVRMERKTDLSVRMGSAAADVMAELQREVGPIARDAKTVIADVREMVERFKDNDFGKYQSRMNELMKDGTIDRVLAALQKFGEIPEKLDELIKSAKGNGVNKFLGI